MFELKYIIKQFYNFNICFKVKLGNDPYTTMQQQQCVQ